MSSAPRAAVKPLLVSIPFRTQTPSRLPEDAALVGKTLAHYRISAALGAGGMGEVFRATDTKLGHEVALKLLPAEFSADPDRLARFEREAKVLASLNHPGIAHLYGFEQVLLPGGATAHVLVMELVPGEDLAERLKRGPIPVDESLAIAKQVAEALEEAHEKGIVHRDRRLHWIWRRRRFWSAMARVGRTGSCL